jgi:arginine decarboxylase
MDVEGPRKLVARVKARAGQQRQSPVRKDHGRAPIGDAIDAYWERDMLSFSIPAHAGGRGVTPEFVRWAGFEAARCDLPMSHGLDTRDRAWKVQATAQKLFAEAVGAKTTLFSTNGSSTSARVAIMAVAGPGETIVMARNGHKSLFAGLVLSGARPVYVDPYYDEELEITLDPLAEDVAEVLDRQPDARAVMVSTPSYYGTGADVTALARVCHERDVPLVTDDAWGLAYALCRHPDLSSTPGQQCLDIRAVSRWVDG